MTRSLINVRNANIKDVIVDLGVVSEGGDPLDTDSEVVASIRLDKEGVENLIRTLQSYIGD